MRHLRLAAVVAPRVVDTHHAARHNAARFGIVFVHLQQRLAFNVSQAFDVDKT